MFERNSKFPRFFILMLIPIAILMLVGMFFNAKIVASAYFVALLIAFVFVMLDRHYGENLTNYKLAFFVFDFINLIAAIVVIYYEFSKHSVLLNVLLLSLISLFLILIVTDCVLVKNKDFSKRHSVLISLVNMGTMICILTYFYNVSELFFVIDALIFAIVSIVIKVMLVFGKKISKIESIKDDFDLVSIIRAESEGDLD